MRKYITVLFVLGLLILSACGNDSGDKKDESQPAEQEQPEEEVKVTEEEQVDDDEIVANINGTDVTGETYNLIYVQAKVQLHQQEQDIEDLEKVKEVALDALVGQALLREEMKDEGIDISKEELESGFESFKEENKEQFDLMLKDYHLTEKAFKEHFHFALMNEKYMEQDIPELEVTDEEVNKTYEDLKKENKEIPELDAVEEQLKGGLKQEKLQEKIEKLRGKAKVDLLI